ncbi:MAG TPA: hypothetical protein VK493_12675, partial [Bryobacteraceae bacterium]|nr:hypothetical protein [Bryobacteraceae bacterium]
MLFVGNADAGVGPVKRSVISCAVWVSFRTCTTIFALVRELDGVADQVYDDLSDAYRIADEQL